MKESEGAKDRDQERGERKTDRQVEMEGGKGRREEKREVSR